MNPEYAPPQQYGMPPAPFNIYGNYPQGAQPPPQHQFMNQQGYPPQGQQPPFPEFNAVPNPNQAVNKGPPGPQFNQQQQHQPQQGPPMQPNFQNPNNPPPSGPPNMVNSGPPDPMGTQKQNGPQNMAPLPQSPQHTVAQNQTSNLKPHPSQPALSGPQQQQQGPPGQQMGFQPPPNQQVPNSQPPPGSFPTSPQAALPPRQHPSPNIQNSYPPQQPQQFAQHPQMGNAPPTQSMPQQPMPQPPHQHAPLMSGPPHLQNAPPMNGPPLQNAPPMSGPPHQNVPPMSGPPQMTPNQGTPYQQPQQRMPMPPRPGTTLPNPAANINNLSGQMSGMNINGPLPPPNRQQNINGPQRMDYPGMPPMPGQQFPPVNGGPSPQMKAVRDPNAPYPPMQHRYPQEHGPQAPGMPPQPSGYPPQPGYAPQGGAFPSAQPSYSQLDPDLMPSPIQVHIEDQKEKNGIFYTNQKGMVPPLVTTDFVAVDQGNAIPRFIRSTMYSVPASSVLMNQTAVPFGLIISPMAELLEDEHPPPLVDFGELGPVRCIRCKAYMSPNMQFFDGGRRFCCLLCKATTEVPGEYFQHVDQCGLRVDRFERPELLLGTYDIVATKEYCRDSIPPKPPAVIFLIDVSYNNIKSGLVSLMCAQMKSFLAHLPKERGQEKTSLRVGFITYNSSVHFYNVNPSLGQPQMLLVGDVHEMFMPLLDGFLADIEQSDGLIDMLMQQIPTMFADTKETETVLAPAIQAGLEALKAAGCAGKLMVFHSSLPTYDAPGKLKNRDERNLLGTDKEKTVLTPQNKFYNELGQDCVQAGCSVDLYIFNNSYIDLPTIGQVAKLTGGDVYKYTYFQADLDGDRVISDVKSNIRRLCAFDAIMRVRTSAGIRPTDFYGHFFMSNTTDIELASIDPDKAVGVEIKHDDKLSEEDGVYIQTALLYTSLMGQRRIRIINLALKACNELAEIYRCCEVDTLMNFFLKQAVHKLIEATPRSIKDNYIQRCAQILACYRKNCAVPSSSGQLILPECLKLMPLHMNSMLKCDAVAGGSDMTIDDRWFIMSAVSTMDVPTSAGYLYPRLIPLESLGDEMPLPIRCTSDKMMDNGVYLLENGMYMFLWLGLNVPSEWVSAVFGVPSTSQVDTDKNRLPVLDNPLSEKIRELLSLMATSKHRSMRLCIVRQRDKMELVMKHFLVEDKGLDGSASYVDFLCHIHKEIRALIS